MRYLGRHFKVSLWISILFISASLASIINFYQVFEVGEPLNALASVYTSVIREPIALALSNLGIDIDRALIDALILYMLLVTSAFQMLSAEFFDIDRRDKLSTALIALFGPLFPVGFFLIIFVNGIAFLIILTLICIVGFFILLIVGILTSRIKRNLNWLGRQFGAGAKYLIGATLFGVAILLRYVKTLATQLSIFLVLLAWHYFA